MNVQHLVSISIVSHAQSFLIQDLLSDIDRHCSNVEVLLTINIPEKLPFIYDKYNFPIRIIHNETPKGFSANHNAAYRSASGSFFCVVNPDIRLSSNPFPMLIERCNMEGIGVVAPLVADTCGRTEKSARRFPTMLSLFAKLFGFDNADYTIGEECFSPDWVAGMFMLFPSNVFEAIGGFDENYFLYYEDVDICARLWRSGYKVVFCPSASIIHDARHESHRNLRYLRWHLSSMVRFFIKRLSGSTTSENDN